MRIQWLCFLAAVLVHQVMADNTRGQVVPLPPISPTNAPTEPQPTRSRQIVPFVKLKTVDVPTEPLSPNSDGMTSTTDSSGSAGTDGDNSKHHGNPSDASDSTLFRWSDQAGKNPHPGGAAKGPPPLGDDPGPFGPYGPFKVDGEAGKQWGLVTRDSDGNLMMQMGTNPSPDALAKQTAQPLNLSQDGQPVQPTAAALSSILSQKQIPPGLTINGKRVSPGDQGEPGASGGA